MQAYQRPNLLWLANAAFSWSGEDGQAAQKMKLSIKDFSSKCDQVHSKLWIWSHLLKQSLMENFIFCPVSD